MIPKRQPNPKACKILNITEFTVAPVVEKLRMWRVEKIAELQIIEYKILPFFLENITNSNSKKTKAKTPKETDSEQFVNAVMNNENVKASGYLKSILKRLCFKRISEVLAQHNKK